MATATKSKMKFQPLGDRVVIRPLEEAAQMRGGLYIPDTAKEKPQEGEVIAVGPGKVTEDGKLQPMSVKVGDKITVRVLEVDMERSRISLTARKDEAIENQGAAASPDGRGFPKKRPGG